MTDKLPISVFIIAKNEADRIPLTIKSVIEWVDEVIVIDSGSDDDTVVVSEALGARVVFNEWNGYGPQKNYGESLCKHDWLFNLDADEEVTPKLRAHIEALFQETPSCSAYKMVRKTLFSWEKEPPIFAIGDKPIRLYNKHKAGFKNSTVHDSVEVREGAIGTVKGSLTHRCFRSLEHWAHKINFYSSLQAEDYVKNGRTPSNIRIIFDPILAFFKSYFLRRYVFYGMDGVVASYMYAHARMIRMAKAREVYRNSQQSK